MERYSLRKVAIRLVEDTPLWSDSPVNTPEAAACLLADEFRQLDREVIMVVNLQADLRPINMNLVTVGALSSAIVHPREVFKSAILSNAECILLIHNHPSGNLVPSEYDMAVTDRIREAGELLGIRLLDHVITGKNGEYYSIIQEEKNQIRHIPAVAECQDKQG